jgi:hypothetical protein
MFRDFNGDMYGIKQQHIILSDFISSPQGLGFRVDHNQPSEFCHKAAQQKPQRGENTKETKKKVEHKTSQI